MKKPFVARRPSLKGKKVIITGGLGFIGSNLAQQCLKAGAHVTVFDCLDPHSGGNLYNVHDIKNKIEIVYGDILNFGELPKQVAGKDILFNCAASTSHPFSMKEPWIDLDVNCRGTINLLEACRRFNKTLKFVHLGTTTQLGKLYSSPADETHPEFPTDIYSANKCVSEKYVLIYGKAYGMPVTVLRLSNVFGPRASIHSSDFAFVNFFIGLGLQSKDMTVYGEGSQLRNLIYIDDCVSAILTAALDCKADGEVFFVAGEQHCSVIEIAKMISRHIGGKVRSVPWPAERKITEVGDAVISNKKIKSALNWRPKYNFSQGLIETRKFYEKSLIKYLR